AKRSCYETYCNFTALLGFSRSVELGPESTRAAWYRWPDEPGPDLWHGHDGHASHARHVQDARANDERHAERSRQHAFQPAKDERSNRQSVRPGDEGSAPAQHRHVAVPGGSHG